MEEDKPVSIEKVIEEGNDFRKIEKLLDANDWNNLEETALSIIRKSCRDLILWSEVLKNVRECKAKLESRSMADEDIELPE